jgi:hypothetical protein
MGYGGETLVSDKELGQEILSFDGYYWGEVSYTHVRKENKCHSFTR